MDKYLDALKKYFGYDSFRGIQREIIESVCTGHDTLGLMPTGGGKSITFQVPALCGEGVCIVITPLISLMTDQVAALRRRHIPAAAIHSGMKPRDITDVLENSIFGGVKILYVSPERLSTPLFITKFRKMRVSLIAVDEAHCICQWGYDFRPAYLTISSIRELHPEAPVLALTATATVDVRDDICRQLARPERVRGEGTPEGFNVFSMSFERPNISYVVRDTNDKDAETAHILNSTQGSAIVYVGSRKRAEEMTEMLVAGGIKAGCYHAGLTDSERAARQQEWMKGTTRVIVATNAFGMGIDKADVRVVIHRDTPDSIEAYFQEAGRAGRDGARSYAVLLHNSVDRRILLRRIEESYPPLDYVRAVYDHCAYFLQIADGEGEGRTYTFDLYHFCTAFRHFPTRAEAALHILSAAGYIFYNENDEMSARVQFLMDRDDLYKLNGLAAEQERTLEALLRIYSGLFSTLTPISIERLSEASGMSDADVKSALHFLYASRILTYIPRQITPTVKYLQPRQESDKLIFPPIAYDDRKAAFSKRINAMLHYAESGDVCRSVLLLDYFGERATHTCGHCDVCLTKKKKGGAAGGATMKPDDKDATHAIMSLLADGAPHDVEELYTIRVPLADVDDALSALISGDIIRQENGKIRITKPQGR